ncbi:hypothetical protein ACET7V_20075 [Aeromonas sanarellii]|uniref:hypothetical protein n=1 Tax=Aeromonas sanarellii TaxID=633415 RepID=UPI0038D112C3
MPLALLALSVWNPVFAIPVGAEIKGDSFRWTSAESSLDGGVAPSVWATPVGLVPAKSYIPGASNLASMPISLVGPKGSNVQLTLQLKGMEYISPSLTGAEGVTGGGSAVVFVSGDLVQVQGPGLGDRSVLLSSEVTPFTHARPLISLGDTAAILQAFRDANAAPGNYVSQVTIPLSYDYERRGVRIRYNWSLPLSLAITYSPAILNDLTLTSPTGGAMAPAYYSSGGVQYAKGQAIYKGVATGVFSNGLRLFLKRGDSYSMTGPNSTSIPFSVVCMQCAQQLLVDNGVITLPDLDTTGTTIPGVNVSTIDFDINIDFTDAPLSILETGAYQGRFSLLFEPNV